MNGVREKLSKCPGDAAPVIALLRDATAMGGLAFLVVKLLDIASAKPKS